ncbi:AAA family ATPase [Alkalilimnicola sp. S0819]|uniref:AAA family ATPase n=1 Tax=Alkalilimnicola sp. S0819 TaxID=2613922 RepID=UPI001261610E|nr:AAA family ATPase [Alkalilimnicola sp. S0819]KAB7627848.1 AAA family ATPase [Alkalilimnicola sp. S0819]MPQ15482.1 AAA family ATPase [Alkalilimnicola sp. S0819]
MNSNKQAAENVFDEHDVPSLDKDADSGLSMRDSALIPRAGLPVIRGPIPPSGDYGEKRALFRYEPLRRHVPTAASPDPVQLRDQLEEEFPWMGKAIDGIYRQLLSHSLSPAQVFAIQPMLLVGPPGCGKSRLARRIAELGRLPHTLIAAGGSRDNMALTGSARGWRSARPGKLIELMLMAECRNPLVIVDELDKTSTSAHNGSILDSMHLLLEPETARRWHDEYLMAPCDMTQINWIATANCTDKLPESLLNRFQVIEVPEVPPEQRPLILRAALAELTSELGLPPHFHSMISDAQWLQLQEMAALIGPRDVRRLLQGFIGVVVQELRDRPH